MSDPTTGAPRPGDDQTPSLPRLLNAKQVGKILNQNPKCVYRLPIPQVRLGPRTVRWKPGDVEAFIDDHYDEAA